MHYVAGKTTFSSWKQVADRLILLSLPNGESTLAALQ
jgi:hypothetical protein